LAREGDAVRSRLLLAGRDWWMKPGASDSEPRVKPALHLPLLRQPLNFTAKQLPPARSQEGPRGVGSVYRLTGSVLTLLPQDDGPRRKGQLLPKGRGAKVTPAEISPSPAGTVPPGLSTAWQ